MRTCNVLRVFAESGEGGNPLGVVSDLAGLDRETMQGIAAELGYPETVFVNAGATPAPQVRIFTPARELEFAGHPLVGCAWFLAAKASMREGKLACGLGEIAFRARDAGASISVAPTAEAQETDSANLVARARLPEPMRAWVVKVPQPYSLLQLPTETAIAGAAPDFAALRSFTPVYLFARDGNRVRARFFAPSYGVDEDPATGSAAFALASLLAHEGEASGELAIAQGAEIGVPCRIDVAWTPGEVRIGGEVRVEGTRVLIQ